MSISLRNKNSRYITLHTESQFYLPGDEIVGTVTYHPKKQVSLRSVKIVFAGAESCVWIERVATRVGGPVVPSKVPLFRKETTLLSDRTRVDATPHTWQFRFYIPRSIPPSCNYNYKATVTYWLKAKAATSFGHFNARFKLPITIGQFWVPSIPPPVHALRSFMGGNIEMTVKSSHSVVKCDDVVILMIHFNNSCYRNLAGVRVKLKQVWECTGVFYHKNVVLKIFCKEGFPSELGEVDSVVHMKLPHRLHLCPTITNSSLFKCTYYIGVYGLSRMAGFSTQAVKCRVPITVTNQPPSEHPEAATPLLPGPPSAQYNSSDEEEPDYPSRAGSHARTGSRARASHTRAASQAHASRASPYTFTVPPRSVPGERSGAASIQRARSVSRAE